MYFKINLVLNILVAKSNIITWGFLKLERAFSVGKYINNGQKVEMRDNKNVKIKYLTVWSVDGKTVYHLVLYMTYILNILAKFLLVPNYQTFE